MKKVLSLVLSVVLITTCLVFSSFAASDIKIADETYPNVIVKGDTFSVYGVITSSSNILSVTVGAYKADGTAAFSYTGKPGRTSYNIHDIDYLMTFSKLDVGTYTYKVVASDVKTANVVLIEKKFTVITEDVESSISISSVNYPEHLIKGKTFSVNGIISSTETLKSVTVAVFDKNNAVQFTRTVTLNAKTFDIHSIDSYMTFSQLSTGLYIYRITASDTLTNGEILFSKYFTVTVKNTVDSLLAEKNMNFVDLSVWNTISSWDTTADNVDGVILRIGYRGTVNRVIAADTKFAEFYKNAKAQNLHVGAYFFSNAITTQEAIEEADYVISKLKENNCKMDMPIYFDMETDAQISLTRQQATDVAKSFCNRLDENGYYAGIYCNASWAQNEIDASQLTDYTLWIAHYNSYCGFIGSYGMWQNSESGSVKGISGNVDTNHCYYDYPTYIIKNNVNGYYTAPEVPFEAKANSGAVIDVSKKTISRVEDGLSVSAFKAQYLSVNSGVTITISKTVDNKIATGTTVSTKAQSQSLGTYKISVNGDTDDNAVINSADALVVLQHVVGLNTLESVEKLSADFNNDNTINSSDSLLVLKYIVEK